MLARSAGAALPTSSEQNQCDGRSVVLSTAVGQFREDGPDGISENSVVDRGGQFPSDPQDRQIDGLHRIAILSGSRRQLLQRPSPLGRPRSNFGQCRSPLLIP